MPKRTLCGGLFSFATGEHFPANLPSSNNHAPNYQFFSDITKLVTRLINLEDNIRDRPLASQHPSLDDYVPINVAVWESSSTMPLERRLSDRCNGHLSSGSFEREAKACYFLSQTLDWRRQGEASSDVRTVLAPLQDFLCHLMDPSTGTQGTFCGAASMAIM